MTWRFEVAETNIRRPKLFEAELNPKTQGNLKNSPFTSSRKLSATPLSGITGISWGTGNNGNKGLQVSPGKLSARHSESFEIEYSLLGGFLKNRLAYSEIRGSSLRSLHSSTLSWISYADMAEALAVRILTFLTVSSTHHRVHLFH